MYLSTCLRFNNSKHKDARHIEKLDMLIYTANNQFCVIVICVIKRNRFHIEQVISQVQHFGNIVASCSLRSIEAMSVKNTRA